MKLTLLIKKLSFNKININAVEIIDVPNYFDNNDKINYINANISIINKFGSIVFTPYEKEKMTSIELSENYTIKQICTSTIKWYNDVYTNLQLKSKFKLEKFKSFYKKISSDYHFLKIEW